MFILFIMIIHISLKYVGNVYKTMSILTMCTRTMLLQAINSFKTDSQRSGQKRREAKETSEEAAQEGTKEASEEAAKEAAEEAANEDFQDISKCFKTRQDN